MDKKSYIRVNKQNHGKERLNPNTVHIQNTAYLLFMPIIIDFFSIFSRQYGIASSSMMTIIIYTVSLIVISVRTFLSITREELCGGLIKLVALFGFFFINYLVFPNSRAYILSPDMIFVYAFFIPISIFSVLQIKDWSAFFNKVAPIGRLTIILATIILLFFEYNKYLVYMAFSYALLPFICNLYICFRSRLTNHYIIDGVLCATGLVCILVFGARAAVLFCVAYLGVFEATRSDKSFFQKAGLFIILMIVVLLTYASLDSIVNVLYTKDGFKDSYFIKSFVEGRLFESKSREVLYESCINRIMTMGLEVSGLFGDRPFCNGFAYPHNIVYEILMSHGWILGGTFLIVNACLILNCVISGNKHTKTVMWWIIWTLMAKFFLSASYVTFGGFWVMMAMLISIYRYCQKVPRGRSDYQSASTIC